MWQRTLILGQLPGCPACGRRRPARPKSKFLSLTHSHFVETPMTKDLHAQPGVREHRLGLTPLGRLAVPQDIAYGILFLASDESAYMTGSELVIDGGISAR
jgi:NAD(P)-dependent dehydrogenase (short-subunit alcohol dehydrogenase family)